jgi:hypothetical protein
VKSTIALTQFGFDWGNAKVTRCMEPRPGCKVVRIETPREDVQIYVSPSGMVRVFNKKSVELVAPKGKAGGKK